MHNEQNNDNFTVLPNFDGHNCFGCSPVNSSGLQMEFYINEKKDSVVSWLSVPSHLCGWSNLVHGGIITTMLDEAMGWAALVILQKLVMSKSISVEFVKPVFIENKIKAEARALKVNNEREGVIQGTIYNDNNEICATSSSVVSLFKIEDIRKMGVVEDKLLDAIESLMYT